MLILCELVVLIIILINNTIDSVYSAVVVTAIARVHLVHAMNADTVHELAITGILNHYIC